MEKLPGNHTYGSVKLKWDSPARPNGLIVSYTIRYQRVNLEHSKGQFVCISHKMFQNLSGEYILKQLENGNYTFAVKAISLAGAGKWSPVAYALIDVNIF